MSKDVHGGCQFSVILLTIAYLSGVEGLSRLPIILIGADVSEASYASDLYLLGLRQWLASAPSIHGYLHLK